MRNAVRTITRVNKALNEKVISVVLTIVRTSGYHHQQSLLQKTVKKNSYIVMERLGLTAVVTGLSSFRSSAV